MSTDAIVLLKEDHTAIRRLFHDFEGAGHSFTGGCLHAREIAVGGVIEWLTVAPAKAGAGGQRPNHIADRAAVGQRRPPRAGPPRAGRLPSGPQLVIDRRCSHALEQ
ncbi:MAG: hypothetical protein QOD82_6286 [Pseudonocardiales bacterium]|nr:hypothetical protein [Pseudonocardiales bacterium]